VAIFYLGDRVECPVCKHTYRKFLPYGRVSRSNALCPNCLSLERHRLIWLFLQKETGFFTENLRILHIAPEPCFIDRFEAVHGDKYITADLESPLARVKMDIHDMPFPDASFDVVFCNHVLEHVKDDKLALGEIHRVLAPKGWGILQIPMYFPLPDKTFEDASITSPAGREKAFGQRDHVRLYGKDYPKRLRQAGFSVSEKYLTGILPDTLIKRHALPPSEPIYFVKKG